MIRNLTLTDVGPARKLEFEFAPRLNILTGDNGLGKSFVLDVLWWLHTHTWAGEKAFPWSPPEVLELAGAVPGDVGEGASGFGSGAGSGSGAGFADGSGYGGGEGAGAGSADGSGHGDNSNALADRSGGSTLDPLKPRIVATSEPWSPGTKVRPPSHSEFEYDLWQQTWRNTKGAVDLPGLVVFARVDGSFALWDFQYGEGRNSGLVSIVLDPSEVWNGKKAKRNRSPGAEETVIPGLIADWVRWQERSRSAEFLALKKVLLALSPPGEPLVPGAPARVHKSDRRDIPTISTEHGTVPVTLASAGIKRAVSLAYLLVWAWNEHVLAAKRGQSEPTRSILLLVDEPELHLHPSWQRVFLPAVLRAIGQIEPNARVQAFAATHSPLVLASLESVFREDLDDLFVIERNGRVVRVRELAFTKEGDVSNWLASEAFGGVGGRSREAELAVEAAMDVMAGRIEDAEKHLAVLEERLHALATITGEQPAHSRPQLLVDRVHEALTRTLPGHDRFWARWVKTWDRHADGRGRS
jgi:hypothetical protein